MINKRDIITEDLDDTQVLSRIRAEFREARDSESYKSVFQMKSPLVTICITTADRGALLQERALTSMLEQTYRNIEVIVAGDCCDDDTAERVAAFQDPRISFINLAARGPYPPPGRARWMVAGTYPVNTALRLAKGDLITHCDEDDTFEPHRIELLVKELQANEADIVYHPFLWEAVDGTWYALGNGNFDHGEISTGTVLYHRWLARIPWDVYAYRRGEPGDWNRFRKIKALGAKTVFVPEILGRHCRYPVRQPFAAKPNELFLIRQPY
jgi:glycosyltransferase involved in cell wall biosynthesis